MKKIIPFVFALAPFSLLVGCGTGVREEVIKVDAANDPLYEPRSILQGYVEGRKLGSESASFDSIVKRVRDNDPAAADALEKGFAELKKTSSASAFKSKAKELLAKIAPKIGGPAAE